MQDGVTLSTKEKDLDVIYGPYAGRFGECELARSSLKYILSDMNDIRKSYIRLGFHLREFLRYKYYRDFGFSTMKDFCDANLGMDKSAVSRCISVFEAFSAVQDNCHKMWLDDRYKDYSYSQLCEMVSMSDEERVQIKPDMTIRQIREKKKEFSRDVSQVATSQQERFDTTNYSVKKGIVQQNYVKNCRSLHDLELRIFSEDGKLVSSGKIYNVLLKEPGTLYLRERANEIIVNEFMRE